jgi:hypothetical protein
MTSKKDPEYVLEPVLRQAEFSNLPVKAHWDAIAKHKEELVKIYTDFAKYCLTGDIEQLKQDAIWNSKENAVDDANEVAFGDAENLRWYLEMVTDPEDTTYETLPNDDE